jgi:protocatechuate 3,4-dioxygenase beta subunit
MFAVSSWMQPRMRRWTAYSAVLVLCSVAAAQQSSTPDAPQPAQAYSLSGRVVNAATGESIPRALIQLQYRGSGTVVHRGARGMTFSGPIGPHAMLTDPQGNFHFDNLAPGDYFAQPQKPGFFSEAELKQGLLQIQAENVHVGPDGDSQISVRLTPEAVVEGHVEDERGEPVRGLPVRVVTSQVVEGKRRWVPAGGATSDEDGEFRMANLRPGTYFVQYGPQWREENIFFDPQKPSGFAQGYWPNSANISSATPLQLHAGQSQELELRLHRTRPLKIEGEVVGVPEGNGFNCQILTEDTDTAFGSMRRSDDQQFSILVGAPGKYRVTCSAFGDSADGQSIGRVEVNVDHDLKGLRVVVAPSSTLAVNIVQEATKPAPQGHTNSNAPSFPSAVELVSLDGKQGQYWTQRDARSPKQMVIRNVQPGAYRLEASVYDRWYVASASYRGRDAWREPIEIGSGQGGEIDVVMRDDGALIHGKIAADVSQRPASVLVLDESRPFAPGKMTGVNPSDGSFTIFGLAPGSYRLYAFPAADLQQIEYSNAKALERYEQRSQLVTVGAGEDKNITLGLIEVPE